MATARNRLPRGFYWRGSVIWVRTDPLTERAKSTGCRTLDGASSWLSERERRAASPVLKAEAEETVGKWSAKICKLKAAEQSEGTAQMYDVKMGHICRVFGRDFPVNDITAEKVDSYIAQRRSETAKNNTIQRELTCLNQMLRHAWRVGVFKRDPRSVKPIKFDAGYVPRNTYLPVEELPLLLAALRPERQAWILAAIATGGDISDVERIQPGDYDPQKQTMRMRGTKNRFRSRSIPIPDRYVPYIEAALPHLPLSWPRISHDLPELCERLEITRVTPKDLRRTAATWLRADGVAIDTLGRWLRHGGAKVAYDVYDAAPPEVTGEAIRQQTQNCYNDPRPLGGMADAGDLKAPSRHAEVAENSEKLLSYEARRKASNHLANTDSLQRAKARVRKLRAAVEVDPSLRPALAVAEGLVEALYLGAGDPDASENLAKALEIAGGAA